MTPDAYFGKGFTDKYKLKTKAYQMDSSPTVTIPPCGSRYWNGHSLFACDLTQSHMGFQHADEKNKVVWKTEDACCGFQFFDGSKSGICVSPQGLKHHIEADPGMDVVHLRHDMRDVQTGLAFEVFEVSHVHPTKKNLDPNTLATAKAMIEDNRLPLPVVAILKELIA